MGAPELLAEVQARGVILAAEKERLLFSPPGSLPEELRAELRAHRGEVLELLRHRRPLAAALPGSLEAAEWPISTAELLRLPLEDFARAARALTVRAEALGGEVVVLASDNARIDPGERRPVYRAAELRALVGLGPAELRKVHEVKRLFNGSILPA